MDKYKVYCETDSKWEYVISSNPPVSCPKDNSHAIRSASISLEEKDVEEDDGTLKSLTLSEYKKLKINSIDKKTKELILQGFTFNGVVFSADDTSQRNWLAIDQLRNDLTYPFGVTAKDDSEYQLADATEVHNFALTAIGTLESHYASGRSLKQSVLSATDEAGVDAVIDNR